jgi:diacylglycerol kinase (ATP)
MATVGVLVHEEKMLGDGLDELRSALADHGEPDPLWRQIDKSKKAPKQVRKLLSEGVDRLLVWGGDGTVRRCVDTIVADGADVELAILPAGTANLLAHRMDVPIDLRGAVDVAMRGDTRRIDVGMINGEAFCLMAGTGFDALLIRDADDAKKDRLGSLAYVRAALANLDMDGTRVKVKVDGDPWFEGRAACVLVGNTGRTLGGLDILPDARPDDGVLDVGVISASGRLDWMRVGARALFGRADRSPLMETAQGTSMAIRLERPLPWELDGGDRSERKKFDVYVLPSRLAVRVPHSADATSTPVAP